MSPYRLGFVMTLALALAVAGTADAGAPTEQLNPAVERVIGVVSDPAMKGEARNQGAPDRHPGRQQRGLRLGGDGEAVFRSSPCRTARRGRPPC